MHSNLRLVFVIILLVAFTAYFSIKGTFHVVSINCDKNGTIFIDDVEYKCVAVKKE